MKKIPDNYKLESTRLQKAGRGEWRTLTNA